MEQVIITSRVSEDAELYQGIRIVDSEIGQKCIVGDFGRVTNSVMVGYNRLERSSLLYYSELGLGSYIGSNSVIMHSTVGKFCSISWGVTIGPANHDYSKLTTHDFLYNDFYGIKPIDSPAAYNRFSKKTIIGNDVWIGTNSTILNGLIIGDGAVIGANTMITKDVPPYSIVVGNPGHIVKMRFEKDLIDELLDLKWWDFPISTIKDNYQHFTSSDIANTIAYLKTFKK